MCCSPWTARFRAARRNRPPPPMRPPPIPPLAVSPRALLPTSRQAKAPRSRADPLRARRHGKRRLVLNLARNYGHQPRRPQIRRAPPRAPPRPRTRCQGQRPPRKNCLSLFLMRPTRRCKTPYRPGMGARRSTMGARDRRRRLKPRGRPRLSSLPSLPRASCQPRQPRRDRIILMRRSPLPIPPRRPLRPSRLLPLQPANA